MAGMETEDINPLNLTLDEVIQLNRLRNKEVLQESSKPDSLIVKNGVVHDDEELTTTIQGKLRDTTNENRTVFDRLGFKRPYQKPLNGTKTTVNQQQALRAIRNAHQFKHRSNVNRLVRNHSAGMPPPLTTHVLRKHNQAFGNFTVRRRTGPGSVQSMSTVNSRPTFYRHSLKKCLDPEIQQLIKSMQDSGQPAMVKSSHGPRVVDLSLLSNYVAKCATTNLPTHVRFAMND